MSRVRLLSLSSINRHLNVHNHLSHILSHKFNSFFLRSFSVSPTLYIHAHHSLSHVQTIPFHLIITGAVFILSSLIYSFLYCILVSPYIHHNILIFAVCYLFYPSSLRYNIKIHDDRLDIKSRLFAEIMPLSILQLIKGLRTLSDLGLGL